jgi:NhaA family Na+:H+ antiporter
MSLVDTVRSWFRGLGEGAFGGILLVLASFVALIWANSSAGASYQALWETSFTLGVGEWALSKPLVLWVNDGLMAIFFLVVGLEIKRELIQGALSSPRKAALPIFAAVGGMAVPAAIFVAFNFGGEGISGWAIPAATDIAFALGILALLGSRVPLELKVFLTAVAVVDDLGAVIIIALFYSGELATVPLLLAAAAFGVAVVLNRTRVDHPLPYILVGVFLWFFVLKSGVHATVAGVMLALAIPARGTVTNEEFELFGRKVFGFVESEDDDQLAPHTRVHEMRELCNRTESLLLRWEHALQPWVLFGVMPVFAFANAGVVIEGGVATATTPVALGVMLGLMIGKPFGVTFFAWLAKRLGLADLPPGVSWLQLHGAGWLAGIGFTMSLFVTSLAFDAASLATEAKLGLLGGSAVAAAIGSALLILGGGRSRERDSVSEGARESVSETA